MTSEDRSGDPVVMAAFNALANDTSIPVGNLVLDLAERAALYGDFLRPGEQYLATVVGATGACLKVLDAAISAGAVMDRQRSFETLMRQMADIWGQLAHEPVGGSTVQ